MYRGYFRPKFLFVATMLLVLAQYSSAANAKEIDCKVPYVVSSGDTLSLIAERAYGKSSKYQLIYYSNQSILKSGPSVIRIGQKLVIPCFDPDKKTAAAETTANSGTDTKKTEQTSSEDQPESPKAQEISLPTDSAEKTSTENQSEPRSTEQVITLLTADDYSPFADRKLPNGGLITELLESALKSNNTPYRVNWINDLSVHIEPLLSEKKYDVGFPWSNPCPDEGNSRCDFLFSKPIFEILTELFTRADDPFEFTKDEDIWGKIVCRPAGYTIHDLNANGRNWVRDNKIVLKQPPLVSDCFEMLVNGEVAGVTLNGFTGRESIATQGLNDKIKSQEREISLNALHALIHKTHPRAKIIINKMNTGLDKINESGQYDEIVNRHLLNYWKTITKINAR